MKFDPTKPARCANSTPAEIVYVAPNGRGKIAAVINDELFLFFQDGQPTGNMSDENRLINTSPIPKSLKGLEAKCVSKAVDTDLFVEMLRWEDLIAHLDKEGLVVVPWDPKQEMIMAMISAFNKDRASWDLVWQAAINTWESDV